MRRTVRSSIRRWVAGADGLDIIEESRIIYAMNERMVLELDTICAKIVPLVLLDKSVGFTKTYSVPILMGLVAFLFWCIKNYLKL